MAAITICIISYEIDSSSSLSPDIEDEEGSIVVKNDSITNDHNTR